jgi:hypothetical protein
VKRQVRLRSWLDQESKSLRKPRDVHSAERSEQRRDRATSAPHSRLAFDDPGKYLRLFFALVNEELVEVGHLDAAASQRFLQIAPIKREKQLGAASDGQGADVRISRISRQRRKVKAVGNLDRIDPTFWKLAPAYDRPMPRPPHPRVPFS